MIDRQSLFGRFIGFAAVGVAGFLIDAGVLLGVMAYLGPWVGRVVSFGVAVTATYALNRRFVFVGRSERMGWWSGLGRFVAANVVGMTMNLASYGLLMAMWPTIPGGAAVAVGVGSVVGLGFNFTLTSMFVFLKRT